MRETTITMALSSVLCLSLSSLTTEAFSSHRRAFSSSSSASATTCPSSTTASATASASAVSEDYGAGQIQVLEGLEPVRRRPGMYIGDTGVDGLHHLAWEVLDNAVDEALSGHARLISLCLNEDGSCTVSDDGRGIPCDTHARTGASALETVLTVLHAGGKFGGGDGDDGGGGYKVSGGLHGVGISVVNALSESTRVRVWRDGKRHRMDFARGAVTRPLETTDGADAATEADAGLSLSDEDENENDAAAKQGKDDEDEDDAREKQRELRKLVSQINSERRTGTEVTFLPDIDVFKGEDGKPSVAFDASRLADRMDEVAYLNAGLTLTLRDRRSNSRRKELRVFHHAGGLSEYVELLCRSKTPLFGTRAATAKKSTKRTKPKPLPADHPLRPLLSEDRSTVLCAGTVDTINGPVSAEIALRYSADQYAETITSFVNNIRTRNGGTHVDGLKACLTRTVNARNNANNNNSNSNSNSKDDNGNLPGEFVREGLTAVVSVKVPDPEFEGQTKGKLGNPEVRQAVDSLLGATLGTVFDFAPDVLEAIVDKATSARAAAAAARAARDVVRRKTLLSTAVLPGKLADCSSRDPVDSEIFLVEGDSAAGSAKGGRDRRTQAVLPLRGKILNVERCDAAKVYANAELQGLISALGLGVKHDEVDSWRPRYGRVIVMTDADVDGAHIRVLLLTFFYRYRRELVENGHVYVAQPPLYKIVVGRREIYAYDDAGKDDVLREIRGDDAGVDGDAESTGRRAKKITVQRFKGLGEMMPKQLWETTMNPATRKLLRVTVDDCALADRTLGMLMGDAVGPRRDFIVDRAEGMSLEDLDV